MKSYLCKKCAQATLVGTPDGALRRRARELVRDTHGVFYRIFRGRSARRQAEAEASEVFLTVPYRYAVLPDACPHCRYRGAPRAGGRERWWDPGLTYRD